MYYVFFRHFGRWGLGLASQPLCRVNPGCFYPRKGYFQSGTKRLALGAGMFTRSSTVAGILPHLNCAFLPI